MQPDLIFSTQSGAFVLLPGPLAEIMRRFTVGEEGRTEAGGILIGSHRGDHMEITDCTTPLRRDVRKPYLFDRKDPGHHVAAIAAWTKSLGRKSFVGEWHTHPEDFPKPSGLDRATWEGIVAKAADTRVFIIVGRKDIWAGTSATGTTVRMSPVK